jgi:TonB family protein
MARSQTTSASHVLAMVGKPTALPLWSLLLVVSTVGHSAKLVRVTEGVLRRSATNVVMPIYPLEAAKSRKEGVAVARVEVNEEGFVSRVEILEAPHPAISTEVSKAVKRWTFKQNYVDGEAVRTLGKLTFYFVLNKGGPRVENP